MARGRSSTASQVPPVSTAVTHAIDLDPEDWLRATWRPRTPRPKPPPAPFNLQDCLVRLHLVGDWANPGWHWERAGLADSLTHEEAHFWLLAMTGLSVEERRPSKRLLAWLAPQPFGSRVTAAEIKARVQREPRNITSAFILPLVHLLGPEDLLALLEANDLTSASTDGWYRAHAPAIRNRLVAGFRRHVLPYLTGPEIEVWQTLLRPRVTPARWPLTDQRSVTAFHLAALLGMHEEIRPVVESWPDDRFREGTSYSQAPQWVLFGLGNATLVERHMRRLQLLLTADDYVRGWLAHTEVSALDLVRDSILAAQRKEDCEELLRVLALVRAPEAAGPMLELTLSARAPRLARKWLDEQVGNAVAGLIPVAAGRGKVAAAALDYLRAAERQGHDAVLRACLESAPVGADRVRREVLAEADSPLPPFTEEDTPPWLQEELRQVRRGSLPEWARAADLPPPTVGERRLNEGQVGSLLAALRRSTLTEPHPLVTAVRQHADRASLDAFAWRLLQRWLSEGAPTTARWALDALGLLGSDALVLQLGSLIRTWATEGPVRRAVHALECLRAIGTDTALMQLHTFSQKQRLVTLRPKAQELMLAVAHDRGLSPAELEDRIVPTCDLDERGSRVFDFGPRRFHFVLGPEMKPMVRDEQGKLRADLPKPAVKDDPERATAAVADWKLLKKQIREVVAAQAQRLEQAMVVGRRWTVAEFERFLVRHPLLFHLSRLLLWGGHDDRGRLLSTFRVTEERDYADVADRPLALTAGSRVGIVHPLQLTEEQRRTWGEVFGDYEIVQPFPQLGRPVFVLRPEEQGSTHINRFRGIKVPALSVVFGLEQRGWSRGGMARLVQHGKPWWHADVTAIVDYQPGVASWAVKDAEDQEIVRCFFIPGIDPGYNQIDPKAALPLAGVHPVILSETLRDLAAVTAGGK